MEIPRELVRLLDAQSGVVARRQVLECGWTRNDVSRMLRRRAWVQILPGIYVSHTGAPTWLQRAWAGVLYYWPAALAGVSAMRVTAGPRWRADADAETVWVAVGSARNVADRAGYQVRYLARFDDQVLAHTHPPRMRFEEACLDVAAATTGELDRIQLLADACQSRRTTPARLLTALGQRTRMPRRRSVESVLHDIAEGTGSVLEHAYLVKVERAHGLPRGLRQQAQTMDGGRVYRDVLYEELGQYVELDGRLFHDDARSHDADLERDLDAALSRHDTVRLGWGQVLGRPCRTAAKVGVLLERRGWSGTVRSCGPDCEVAGR